jgi:hypothetical protein
MVEGPAGSYWSVVHVVGVSRGHLRRRGSGSCTVARRAIGTRRRCRSRPSTPRGLPWSESDRLRSSAAADARNVRHSPGGGDTAGGQAPRRELPNRREPQCQRRRGSSDDPPRSPRWSPPMRRESEAGPPCRATPRSRRRSPLGTRHPRCTLACRSRPRSAAKDSRGPPCRPRRSDGRTSGRSEIRGPMAAE